MGSSDLVWLVSWLAPSLSGNIRLVLAKELNANFSGLKKEV